MPPWCFGFTIFLYIILYIILYYTVSTFVRTQPRRYRILRLSLLTCTNSLQFNCLLFPTWLFYATRKILVMCKKLITFYAILFDNCSLMPMACGPKHVAMLSTTASYLRKSNVNFVAWMLPTIYDKPNCIPSIQLSYVMTVIFGSSEQLNRQYVSNTRAIQTPISTNQPSKTKQDKLV